jgi:AcrR family transcriptional regulator
MEPSAAARPLRRDAQRNRDRIRATARALFAERGIETSLDDIAHAADVGVGTVYRHYPTKDALLDELFEEKIDQLASYAEAAADEPDPWLAFTRFLEHLAGAFAENRTLEDILLHFGRGQERVALAKERLGVPVLAIVDRAKAAGVLSPAFEPSDVGMIHTMIAALIRERHDRSPELWRRALRLILDGVAAQARGESTAPSDAEPTSAA